MLSAKPFPAEFAEAGDETTSDVARLTIERMQGTRVREASIMNGLPVWDEIAFNHGTH
jgi:hypothetical protein